MTLIDDDLAYLLADEPLPEQAQFREIERDFDIWFEEGPWLLLLLLPLAALSFRRGWLWSVMLIALLPPAPAEASLWDDLWQRRDQQAAEALAKGDPVAAAELFEDTEWKGTAQYRAEEYTGAVNAFTGASSADGIYNLGNALARQGDYQKAINAYDQSLALNPQHEDAAFNKQLVEKLLEQQQQQEQQEGNDEQNQDSQDSDESQQQQSDQDQQNQQSEDQQQSENDNTEQQDEQDSEQKEGEQQQSEQTEQQQMAEADPQPLDEEQQQALEQWLRRVPDDPGGLLRRKFEMQYNEKLKKGGRSRHDSSDW